MSTKLVKPLGAAVGLALLGSAGLAAAGNPFVLNDLGTGYQLAGEEGKCGEGKCGEGRCGMDKLDTDGDGSISRAEWDAAGKPADKFAQVDANGDGLISAEEAAAFHHAHEEGKCGEGKCGEGKCGGSR
ncbi:HvfA family oxazolone/thioamide-modified RiPP metallophore [Pseudofulvimonas gallinarii]|jgi:uncharacterized low-complexity protein|uniref:EF hand domain-containing protein n=1 Tax=Pseudofulvimonas gallinarii TaxID=634155 RepID=A0A4R3LEH0_9GAMM|nr:calcium-binding protein [Pseudofulvimonas gallinarii]TCS97788.1 EF hand domain-containing protein [Pseudofulvimonas gallinarii]THD13410.1 hypothetical protein B1808_08520 [Pseudofulvimonas gallinarii]